MLRAAGAVALDTEGDSLHHYPERLSLIQIAVPAGGVWLVDPLALPDLRALAAVLGEPGVLTVLHAGDNDLTYLKRQGVVVATLFDTSIAARFLGGRALGLEALLEQFLGVSLPPSRQKDDWSARPLSEAQMQYAIADVTSLFALKARLVEELRSVGRLTWVEEECAALAALPLAERIVDPDAALRLKGARELSPRGLAIVRALHDMREQAARASDRPPFKILGDEMLVTLAGQAPIDAAALALIPGLNPRVAARWGARVVEAVAGALALPEADLPRPAARPPRRAVPAAVTRRVESLRRWRAEAVPRLGLEPGVLLPNRLIGAVAEADPRSLDVLAQIEGIRRWRVETFGGELLATLAGA